MESCGDADCDSCTPIIHLDGSPIDQRYTVHTHIVEHIMRRQPVYIDGLTAYTVIIRIVT